MMLTHDYGPFRRFLLGSVTAKILHDAACPVWTSAHLETWPVAGDVGIRKVLGAVDFGPRQFSGVATRLASGREVSRKFKNCCLP